MVKRAGGGVVLNRLFRGPKGAFIVIVILGVVALLVVLPLIGAISDARADLSDITRKFRNLVPIVHKIFLQMENLKAMRLRLVDMKRRYGGADRIDKVLHLLNIAASEQNVVIKDWIQKPKEQDGIFIKIPVKMRLICRYTDLAAYLNRITSAEYICVVTSLLLSDNREVYPNISVCMTIELVFVDPNVEIGE